MVAAETPVPQPLYEAVSRGKKEWEQTFDAVPDLIFITDAHHTISRANLAVSRRLGIRPEEVPGRKCYELFHGLPAPPSFCPYLTLLGDGGPPSVEVAVENLGGVFDISVSPLYNDAGEFTACVHVARDVTERKKAEEYRLALEQQLLQAQKLESLGVLTGGIAHDFNNILMIILGHCLIGKDQEDPAALRKHLEQIETAGNRAADLCRQMLIYAGKSPLIQTRIDLGCQVDEILGMLQPAFRKNVRFARNGGAGLPDITGDRGKIQQIVMNLVVNAVEAIGEEAGVVSLSIDERVVAAHEELRDFFGNLVSPGRYLFLEVADTGCGMDQETQKRIFEPFFSTKFTGRGLGMAAISGIVRSHSGALQLVSSPGVGTTFTVYFPVAPPETAHREPLPRTSSPGRPQLRGTILLVDDEEEVRSIGAKLVAALGLTVLTACDGQEALEIHRRHADEIDLVLMDLTMPGMDGIQTYQKLRRAAPALAIVFCSGYGEKDVSPSIAGDPRAGFVPKPYQVEQLREALELLLPPPE